MHVSLPCQRRNPVKAPHVASSGSAMLRCGDFVLELSA
ncbi:hypothetical protein RKLH11_677 [Rhodobacteraceae bacterium KLH11]|nr:hypothetical protein RKLH11_677 [Rhodobacteraceae bacterium KLH11]